MASWSSGGARRPEGDEAERRERDRSGVGRVGVTLAFVGPDGNRWVGLRFFRVFDSCMLTSEPPFTGSLLSVATWVFGVIRA